MSKREHTHGGRRPGAGRQPIGSAPRKTISASLEPDLVRFIEREAEASGVSRSAVIAYALEELQMRVASTLAYEPDYENSGRPEHDTSH